MGDTTGAPDLGAHLTGDISMIVKDKPEPEGTLIPVFEYPVRALSADLTKRK